MGGPHMKASTTVGTGTQFIDQFSTATTTHLIGGKNFRMQTVLIRITLIRIQIRLSFR
jgi:hypothetical protein